MTFGLWPNSLHYRVITVAPALYDLNFRFLFFETNIARAMNKVNANRAGSPAGNSGTGIGIMEADGAKYNASLAASMLPHPATKFQPGCAQ